MNGSYLSVPVFALGVIAEHGTQPNRVSRYDALPEDLEWRDGGCEVAPSCLACPLPACRYDVPGGARALRNAERDRAIRRAHAGEESVAEIAERFGVSRRTVFRVLAGGGS